MQNWVFFVRKQRMAWQQGLCRCHTAQLCVAVATCADPHGCSVPGWPRVHHHSVLLMAAASALHVPYALYNAYCVTCDVRCRSVQRGGVVKRCQCLLAAFDQLVDFVHANTPPGQTPVIVGHQGFELSFKHVEQYMRRVAAAAGTSGRGGPTSSNTGLIGGSTTDLNSSSSTASTSTSSGKGRRRRVAPVAADPSTPNTSSSTSSKGYQHSSWPQDWMFLDTYVMAQVLQSLPPSHDTRGEAVTGSTLQQMLRRCLYKKRPPAGYEFEDVHMPEV